MNSGARKLGVESYPGVHADHSETEWQDLECFGVVALSDVHENAVGDERANEQCDQHDGTCAAAANAIVRITTPHLNSHPSLLERARIATAWAAINPRGVVVNFQPSLGTGAGRHLRKFSETALIFEG